MRYYWIILQFVIGGASWAQTPEELINHFNYTVGLLNEATIPFNEAMACWKPRGADYVCGIEKLLEFEQKINPILRGNPLLDYDIIKLNATGFKDMARRYIRFMINCSRNRPSVCDDYNCLELAWRMAENIKSLNLRYGILQHEASQLNEADKRRLTQLFDNGPERNYNAIVNILPAYKYLYQDNTTMAELSGALAANEVFVSFLMTDNRRPVYAWIIRKNQPPKVIRLGQNSADLFFRIETVKAIFEGDQDWRRIIEGLLDYEDNDQVDGRKPYPPFTAYELSIDGCLRAFYEGVLQPLGLRKGERVIFSPDQNLSSLPFNALKPPNTKEYFYQTNEFTFIPSGKIYLYLKAFAGHSQPQNATAFFGFAYGGDIPYSVDEVYNSQQYFRQPEVLLGPEFYESKFYNVLGRNAFRGATSIVHIASHSTIIEGQYGVKSVAIKSHIDESNDGLIMGEELGRYLPEHLQLLVLSGCETAPSSDIKDYFGRIIKVFEARQREDPSISFSMSELILAAGGTACICSYGETFSDITSSVLARKARTTLMSQWKIDDLSTSEYFSVFYRHLNASGSIPGAHRAAMDAMNDRHIGLWAPFITIGI